MKNDYTLLIFNNSILISVQSPSHCLFDSDVFSLEGKPIEYFFIGDSINTLSQLENGRKTSVNLCAKTTGAIFSAFAVKVKFQKTELITVYTKENMSVTNSDAKLYEKYSVLDKMMLEQNKTIFRMIDEIKTTRNIQQIKRLKETFFSYYHQLADCVMKLTETRPQEKYQFESFHLSPVLKNYFDTLEKEYPNKIWVSYENFMSAHVLGNRDHLISLLDHFFLSFLQENDTKISVKLMQKNDAAITEFTVLTKEAVKVEFSEEFLDFSKNERDLLAKKAGCTVTKYAIPGVGVRLSISYDTLVGYRLYEGQD